MRVTEETMITVVMTAKEHATLIALLDEFARMIRPIQTGDTPGYRDELESVRIGLHRPPPA